MTKKHEYPNYPEFEILKKEIDFILEGKIINQNVLNKTFNIMKGNIYRISHKIYKCNNITKGSLGHDLRGYIRKDLERYCDQYLNNKMEIFKNNTLK